MQGLGRDWGRCWKKPNNKYLINIFTYLLKNVIICCVMPRQARIYQKGLCYHLMNRGINGLNIFDDSGDCAYFSNVVKEYKEACDAQIYHWCWMDTHYHMMVEISFENLRAFAGGLQQVYAQYHHRRHGTSGVFWQGRYKSKPVEIGDYLVRCGRYIERNPVRAMLVDKAWKYQWSSAQYYVVGKNDELTDRNKYLYGSDLSDEERKYYGDVLSSTEDDEWMDRHSQYVAVGSERYLQTVRARGGRFRLRRGRPSLCKNK